MTNTRTTTQLQQDGNPEHVRETEQTKYAYQQKLSQSLAYFKTLMRKRLLMDS